MIEQIVQTLTRISTRWKPDEALVELSGQGLRLTQNIGKRRTFQDREQQRYSLYFGDDDVLIFAEATLEVVFDTESMSDEDYARLLGKFNVKFRNALSQVSALLGSYDEYTAQDEFPHDRDCITLALWKLDDADIMLELKHEAREVPLRLVLALAS